MRVHLRESKLNDRMIDMTVYDNPVTVEMGMIL